MAEPAPRYIYATIYNNDVKNPYVDCLIEMRHYADKERARNDWEAHRKFAESDATKGRFFKVLRLAYTTPKEYATRFAHYKPIIAVVNKYPYGRIPSLAPSNGLRAHDWYYLGGELDGKEYALDIDGVPVAYSDKALFKTKREARQVLENYEHNYRGGHIRSPAWFILFNIRKVSIRS